MLVLRIKERDVLEQLVEQAMACRTFLTTIFNFSLAYFDKDLGVVSEKLTTAVNVATDSGALSLDKVFELIMEGENLPSYLEKEIKRAMIAFDQCDEWYHFDCINLVSPPKVYICPACKPQQQDLSATPSVDLDG
ncbi:hypothetical protein SO802_033048 [Lithocarpus litseifolius]|uniref:PHD-type domain-containing protein n=1 Tax=Lithocarpus litseifolius TaxID=425828 RepID=A0AAW2BDQ2_9ROSI